VFFRRLIETPKSFFIQAWTLRRIEERDVLERRRRSVRKRVESDTVIGAGHEVVKASEVTVFTPDPRPIVGEPVA
jgi:hypothetical protein